MKFQAINPEGRKSIDRKVASLVATVNKTLAHNRPDWTEAERIDWAQATIEGGIQRIAASFFADRIA